MPLQFYAFDVLTLAGGSLQNQRLVACNVENDSGLSYRNEAGRPPPNLPLVRGRDFQRYRFQCYSPLVLCPINNLQFPGDPHLTHSSLALLRAGSPLPWSGGGMGNAPTISEGDIQSQSGHPPLLK